jgi:uncharacterized membrane protein
VKVFGREPVAIIAAVQAVILLAVAFGVSVSDQQTAAIVGAVGAILALLGGGVARSRVSPVSTGGGE